MEVVHSAVIEPLQVTAGGHRGYVASRPIRGRLWPQHVQNMLLRSYADRLGLQYRLSVTEYAMADCFMGLKTILEELEQLDGMLIFSLFMLPSAPARRNEVVETVLNAGKEMHFALEDIAVRELADWRKADDILRIDGLMTQAVAIGAGQ